MWEQRSLWSVEGGSFQCLETNYVSVPQPLSLLCPLQTLQQQVDASLQRRKVRPARDGRLLGTGDFEGHHEEVQC